jgi:endonuclease/exonuclease/phosphatase family metal-dependent hydrolase
MPSQARYIIQHLPEYAALIAPRSTKGEACLILYKKSKFNKIDSGMFWLSETPEVKESKSWGSNFPRVVAWIKLRNKSGLEFYVFGVHLDTNKVARIKSSKLLKKLYKDISSDYPAIIMGDFNDIPESETHRTLTESLFDSLFGNDSTRPGFSGLGRSGRIDWILLSRHINLITSEIRNSRGISDHLPVLAIIDLPELET